jgi:hypothetical protein
MHDAHQSNTTPEQQVLLVGHKEAIAYLAPLAQDQTGHPKKHITSQKILKHLQR